MTAPDQCNEVGCKKPAEWRTKDGRFLCATHTIRQLQDAVNDLKAEVDRLRAEADDEVHEIVVQCQDKDDIVLEYSKDEYDAIIEAGVTLLIEKGLRDMVEGHLTRRSEPETP